MVGQSHSALHPSAVSVAELSALFLVEDCPYLTNYNYILIYWGRGDRWMDKFCLVTAYLFLSLSSDIFSSQNAMPNSFPNI